METAATSQPRSLQPVDSRRLIAVVYADMAGYSRLIAEDDAGTCARLAELRADLIDPALTRHGGRLVHTAGDSMLVLFDSILSAMRFAIEVQRAMPSFDGDYAPDRRIRFRMGVNVGDIVPDGTNVHGDGLNVAARLQSVCPIGEICVSRVVREQVGNRLGLPFKELGALDLKNIGRPVEAFVLDPAQAQPLPAIAAKPRWRVATAAMLAVLALIVAGTLVWQFRARAPRPPGLAAAAQTAGVHEPPPLSIAVLPFDNLSGDPEQSYLADGIAEDLTTDLVHLAGAFVIARESAFSFRGKAVDIRDIGRQLGVRYLVEGSVRKIGANVRINTQLIAAQSGAHVWAERFDKPITSLGEGQDDIVKDLASALDVNLVNLDSARQSHAQSGSPAAFDLVLRARAVLNEPPTDDRAYIALGYYLQALRADPTSVPAMAGTAAVFAGLFRHDSGDNTVKRAADLVAAAEAKAPDSPDVLAVKFLVLLSEGRTRDAFAMYNHLLDVNPSATGLILQIGTWRPWWWSPEEELSLLDRTIRLNPRSVNVNAAKTEYGSTLLMLGRNAEAVATLEPLVAQTGSSDGAWNGEGESWRRWQSYARLWLAVAYARTQRLEDAKRMAAQALRADDLREFTVRSWLRGFRFYHQRGNLDRANSIADALRLAGVPDHLDETADSGVPSTGELRDFTRLRSPTPMSVPGGRTLVTQDVVALLANKQPLILTTVNRTPTIPGTIFVAVPASGALDDDWQPRLSQMMHDLVGADTTKPVLVFGFNLNRWDSRNLALRLIALGYTDVAWYRGGWEAWEASGQPAHL